MGEPVWVREDVVLAIHRRQLAEHGGSEGIRDIGLLDSALSRPKNLFAYTDEEADLASLAAAYAWGLARISHRTLAAGVLKTCRDFEAVVEEGFGREEPLRREGGVRNRPLQTDVGRLQ